MIKKKIKIELFEEEWKSLLEGKRVCVFEDEDRGITLSIQKPKGKNLLAKINGLKSQNSFYLNRYREAVVKNIKLKEMIKKLKRSK